MYRFVRVMLFLLNTAISSSVQGGDCEEVGKLLEKMCVGMRCLLDADGFGLFPKWLFNWV